MIACQAQNTPFSVLFMPTTYCFRGQELELCDITKLLTGCNRALSTDYPCTCFFATDICTLCNNLQLICPPDITTTADPVLTTTLESTTEPSSATFSVTTSLQPSSMLELTTTVIPLVTTTVS